MRSNWLIDRRTCLRGLGVALALPLLETMGWADPPKGAAFKAPVRLGFVYHNFGVIMPEFWPTAATFPAVLPKTLEPLKPVIDQCLVLDGLDNLDHGPFPGAAHGLELSTWLTATLPDATKRGEINIAPSADQIAAKQIGAYTALPSLELGTHYNGGTYISQEMLSGKYFNTASFRTANEPLPVECNPGNVYRRLFSSRQSTPQKRGGPAVDAAKFAAGASAPAGDEQTLDRSMLDLVLEGAKDLRGSVSLDDQHCLDDYLDSVRSLEKRVAAIERQQAEAARTKSAKGTPTGDAKRSELIDVQIPNGPLKWSEHVKVMGDLMVLAFQADLTRVVTLLPSGQDQGINFPELGFTDAHHAMSHHDRDQEKIDKVAKIDRFHMEQFAYIIGRMRSLREGPGTLLDNSIVMWGSGLQDGATHGAKRIPTILAGKGGGTLRTGRMIPKVNGNTGDLLTAILARAGVTVEKPLGNGTKLMPDLS
jgi:hypothetical protein